MPAVGNGVTQCFRPVQRALAAQCGIAGKFPTTLSEASMWLSDSHVVKLHPMSIIRISETMHIRSGATVMSVVNNAIGRMRAKPVRKWLQPTYPSTLSLRCSTSGRSWLELDARYTRLMIPVSPIVVSPVVSKAASQPCRMLACKRVASTCAEAAHCGWPYNAMAKQLAVKMAHAAKVGVDDAELPHARRREHEAIALCICLRRCFFRAESPAQLTPSTEPSASQYLNSRGFGLLKPMEAYDTALCLTIIGPHFQQMEAGCQQPVRQLVGGQPPPLRPSRGGGTKSSTVARIDLEQR